MLRELTTEQAEKLARGWVWVEGQKPAGRFERVSRVVGAEVECAIESPKYTVAHWFAPGELTPDLSDDVTRDGLLRTCRKAWMDDAFAMRSLSGKWKVYVRSGFEEHVFEGATEEGALLAAILAAPEAT